MTNSQYKPKIYVCMTAYNAEKTIRRAIESVLGQTYKNILFCILDNGSTDNTYAICEKYALQDERIVLKRIARNHIIETEQELKALEIRNGYRYGTSLNENDFICVLDSDDEYMPEFFGRAIRFAEEENLDIVIGGTDIIDAQTEKTIGRKIYDNNWIINNGKFSDVFDRYHWHMRQVWGKLYRRNNQIGLLEYYKVFLEKELKNSTSKTLRYGADTINSIYSFCKANKIGVLSGCQHKYYMHNKSVSHSWDINRIVSDRILDKATRGYLLEKCGKISPQNEDFLRVVYFNAISDTIKTLLDAQISVEDKLSGLYDIFNSEQTQQITEQAQNSKTIKRLLKTVEVWVLEQRECRRKEGADTASEILFAMYKELRGTASKECLEYVIMNMPEMVSCLIEKDYDQILRRIGTWFKRHDSDVLPLTELEIHTFVAAGKTDDEMFALLLDIKKKRPQASRILEIDILIVELLEKYPLLKDMSTDLASSFPRAIQCVMRGDPEKALNAFVSVQNMEINDKDAEAYILFGQNLSAAAGDTGVYIYFKKIWISYLIECSRLEKADKELEEMKSLLPDDEDFIKLRNRLSEVLPDQ